MKKPTSIRMQSLCAVFCMATATAALADGYNVIFKTTGDQIISCATGGLSFDKGSKTDGNYAPTSPSFSFPASCLVPGQRAVTFDALGTVQVAVRTTASSRPGTDGQTELLNNGPNVEGLVGVTTKSLTSPTQNFRLTFGLDTSTQPYTRTFRVVRFTGSGTEIPIANGKYFIYNTIHPIAGVPEPETLALLGVGLAAWGGLAWRRRAKSLHA